MRDDRTFLRRKEILSRGLDGQYYDPALPACAGTGPAGMTYGSIYVLVWSELIREAVDGFLDRYGEGNRQELLRGARGMWKDRDDLPDFEALRREFDRGGEDTVEL